MDEIETGADDLRSQLEAAFEAPATETADTAITDTPPETASEATGTAAEPTGTETTAEPTEATEAQAQAARERDEHGRFKAKAGEEAKPGEQPAAPEAPDDIKRWSDEDRAAFAALPKEGQDLVLRRHKAMEADYTRKTQEVASTRRELGEVSNMIERYRPILAADGITPAQGVENLVRLNDFYLRDPAAYVAYVVENTPNIDKAQLLARLGLGGTAATTPTPAPKDDDDEFLDPAVVKIRDEAREARRVADQAISTLTASQRAEQARQAEAEQGRIVSEIDAAATETGPDGKPVRPYFDTVLPDMTRLAAAERAAGRTPKIADLYDTAVWANPTTRAQLLADQAAADRKRVEDEQRTTAAAARNAGSSVSGRGPAPAVVVEDLPLREQLERLVDAGSGARI
jgi:hypothetical protein